MDNLLLFVGTLIFGAGAYLKYEHSYNHASKITPKVAKQFINCKAKVIDVRTEGEFKLGSVTRKNSEGKDETIAIHIPGKDINDDNLTKKGVNKDDIIIVFCNSGTRARKAADKMIKLGYKNVFYIVETYKSLQ